jgi:uncharacterized protein YceH (UPF0502 family)
LKLRSDPYNLPCSALCADYDVAMKIELNPLEARVIGCLIEKEITTPDQYPLSLNAVVSACNQKSNREPVMTLDELTVQRTIDELTRKHLVLDRSGFGSRVTKYRHCFCNTEFGTLKFDPQELAIMCELLLRGPQTPGELRSRASRMASFTDGAEVEACLARLSKRDGTPYVTRLTREPGRREPRYAQLFGGVVDEHPDTRPVHVQHTIPSATPVPEMFVPAAAQEERLTQLEHEVQALRDELSALKTRLSS